MAAATKSYSTERVNRSSGTKLAAEPATAYITAHHHICSTLFWSPLLTNASNATTPIWAQCSYLRWETQKTGAWAQVCFSLNGQPLVTRTDLTSQLLPFCMGAEELQWDFLSEWLNFSNFMRIHVTMSPEYLNIGEMILVCFASSTLTKRYGRSISHKRWCLIRIQIRESEPFKAS